MLETLRRGANSKIAAIVFFAPLILAFAIWGIGPGALTGNRPWIAKVGDTTIYPEEFNSSFRSEVEQISRQAGRPISPDQARAAGLDRRVLARLAGTAALDQLVQRMGLSESTDAIAEATRSDPSFAGPDGKFDKTRFEEALRQIGMTEAGYVASRRRDDLREQLTDSILTGVTVPADFVDLINSYRNETRVISFATIDPAKAAKIAEPTDAQLQDYYNSNKNRFVVSQLRKIGVLSLTRDSVKTKIAVSDDEVKKAYESDAAKYDIPETRHVLQMSFKDKAAADAAQPQLAKSRDFVATATRLGATASDVDLGVLTKSKLIDPKIADVAFSLQKNDVSKVIEGTFTNAVVKVTDITPGQKKSFADVAAQVKDQLQAQRAGQELQSLDQQVEDERNTGKPLADIAKDLGLDYKEIAAITADGMDATGKPVLTGPSAKPIADAAFGAAVGLDPDPIDLDDGGVAWVTVLGITPAKERPFDEVKADVKSAWTDAETRKALGDAAAKFVDRLKAGEPLATIATEAGGKVETTSAITRTSTQAGMTASAVAQAFALPKGGAGSAATADGKSRTLFVVDTINPPAKPSAQQSDRIKGELTQEMQSDALNAFVDASEKRLGLKINDPVLMQVLGVGRQAP